MIDYIRPRSGVFVRYEGHEYEAESYPAGGVVTLISTDSDNPDPAVFQRDEESEHWSGDVLTAECERIDEVVTMARYHGHDCTVVAVEPHGAVGLRYVGKDKTRLIERGFVQIEGGVLAKTVNIFELGGMFERHTDLLFDEWRATRNS